MSSIEDPKGGNYPISHRDAKLYRQEYRQGLDLFQRALDEYEKADEIHKKDAFREVMDRALRVLNETARELKRPDLLNCNDKLSQDFANYQEQPEKDLDKTLRKDLKDAKKAID